MSKLSRTYALTVCLGLAACTTAETVNNAKIEVVREGLHLPASLEFAPNGDLYILDRGLSQGNLQYAPTISVLDLENGQMQILDSRIPATSHFDDLSGNQAGAMGLALDPDFQTNHRLYVCYHYRAANGRLGNRLSSFVVGEQKLDQEFVIIDELPADSIHNGCRVAVGTDRHLYLTTGSMEPFDDGPDLTRLSGKVLRVTVNGEIPPDNPFPNSPIWTYGHRNAQGLTFDYELGTLWSTEHGENSADELNRLERGAYYGWPACRGSAALHEKFAVEPYWADRLAIDSGKATCLLNEPHASRYRPAFRTYFPDRTVGISDLVVYRGSAFPEWRGSLLITMLRAKRLVRVEVRNNAVSKEATLIDGEYGRLRDVAVGPDGFVYVLTNESSSDGIWRGQSRLLRIRP